MFAPGRHEFVRELVEFRVFRILIREGGDEAIRERAGRIAELFGRACQAGVGTQRFQGGGAAQQVAVAPRPAILLRVGPPGHPPPEGGAVRPLDEHPHPGRGQLGGNGHVHRGDRVEVGLARPESVQRIGVRVVGDEDRLQGGRDVPCPGDGLLDDLVLPACRLRHGESPIGRRPWRVSLAGAVHRQGTSRPSLFAVRDGC